MTETAMRQLGLITNTLEEVSAITSTTWHRYRALQR